MPEKPPSPTPCTSLKRLHPAASASSERRWPACSRSPSTSSAYSVSASSCSSRSSPSSVSVAAALISSRRRRSRSIAASSSLSARSSSHLSTSVLVSRVASGATIGMPPASRMSMSSSVASGDDPPSWCSVADSVCRARRTPALLRCTSPPPAGRMTVMPGLSPRGCVCLPARSLLARPSALMMAHMAAPP